MLLLRGTAVIAACAAALITPGLLPAQNAARTVDTTSTGRVRVTSQQRIRVQKELGDEARQDSVAQAEMIARADSLARLESARRDSVDRAAQVERDALAAIERARSDSVARVERMRLDSLAAIETARRDSVERAEALAREEQLRLQRIRDRYLFNGTGWYIGLSGGGAVPTGDFEKLGYQSGYNVNVPIGWHGRSSFLGARLDLGYSQFGSSPFVGTGVGGAPVTLSSRNPKVLSAALNLTARAPLTASRNVNLYALGGAGLYHFRSFGPASALGGFLGNDVLDANDVSFKQTRNKLGAQVGAGIDFGLGPASLFLETRVVNVYADRDNNVQFRDFFGDNRGKDLRWIPIVLGFNFR